MPFAPVDWHDNPARHHAPHTPHRPRTAALCLCPCRWIKQKLAPISLMYPGQVMTDSRSSSSVERQVVNSISCYCQCSTNVITHTHIHTHSCTHTSHCGNDINERSNCAGKLIECGCCDLSTAPTRLVVAFNWASLCFVSKPPELSQQRSKVTVNARWECVQTLRCVWKTLQMPCKRHLTILTMILLINSEYSDASLYLTMLMASDMTR